MERNCENCKHWNKPNPNSNIGKCKISNVRHPMMHTGCGLYTHQSFGCKLFETEPVDLKATKPELRLKLSYDDKIHFSFHEKATDTAAGFFTFTVERLYEILTESIK